MAVLSVGLGVIVLDGTIVGVALPSIITDLQFNLTQAQWVNSLYAVLLAAVLLSTGKIADTWGSKRAFLSGLTIFVAGSVLAGFSTSAATLISTLCRF
ncbi:MFS transporter [Corynebacterium accolens]|uniref:MFS transporter n=1 Tax=Corynebacterium accolens TaxID=38284 RepID=A0ABT7FPY8_9CORY|nr:MFS transporter [Corynebacterium accolens]MDK4247658.1 MFS transporter [Corynebacterium accolens]